MVTKSKKATKARSAKRSASLSVNPKEFMAQCVQHIAKKIIASKDALGGRTPRGVAEKLLQEGKKVFPNMSMNMINYAIKKIETKVKPKVKNSTVTINEETCISSLTGESSNNDIPTNTVDCEALRALLLLQKTTTASETSTTTASETSTNLSNHIAMINTSSGTSLGAADTTISEFLAMKMNLSEAKNVGRPKGSTSAAAKSLNDRIESATKEAAEQLAKLYKNKSRKNRLNKGSLEEIIEKSKEKHGVGEDTLILKETVRQRVKRGSKSGHIGQTSPMAQIEPYLVELILQLASMRTPITTSQGLQLANSLISGTRIQNQINDWKRHNCHAYKVASQSGNGNTTLSLGYWSSFLRRNAHLITSKKAVKFDNKRAE
jgi:hypothetical protein